MNRKSILLVAYMVIYFIALSIPGNIAHAVGNYLHLFFALVSAKWLFDASRKAMRKESRFWLVLMSGSLCYAIAQAFWIYEQVDESSSPGSIGLSDIFWVLHYVFFFFALMLGIYMQKTVHITIQRAFFLFMLLIASFALMWDYLDSIRINEDNNWMLFTLPIFAMLNIWLIVGYMSLYTTTKARIISVSSLFFICIGFFVKFLANVVVYYLAHSQVLSQYFGSYIDLLWSFGLLIIGYSGSNAFYDRAEEHKLVRAEQKVQRYGPYAISSVLFITMFYEMRYEWDALIFGSIAALILLIAHQLVTLDENRRLLIKHEQWNKHLEMKVQERTIALNEKSKQLEEALVEVNKMAFYDSLTGLPNRNKLHSDFEEMRSNAGSEGLALFFVDLDKFKLINDSMGHKIGDLVLQRIAEQLKAVLGKGNSAYRFGGDEFIVLVNHAKEQHLKFVARQTLLKLAKPFEIGDKKIEMTASIGVSLYPRDGNDLLALIKHADIAMYEAKASGRNKYRFFDAESKELLNKKIKLELDLKQAVQNKAFELYYQPQIDLETGEIFGYEALLRWKHPEWGMISPLVFIPIAEETGIIQQLGEFVLQKACETNKKWQEHRPNLRVAVNVSVKQLNDEFVHKVASILRGTGLKPEYLELEITESVTQQTDSIELIRRLKGLGVKIAMDDFGTGYSCLSVLKSLPIDYLKLDRSFVNDVAADSITNSIIETIIVMGHQMGIKVIAEGVENEIQYETLKKLGCDILQGYYISVPLPEDQILMPSEHK